ncbi:MAG: ABC transporter permease [Planctomycetes bacterium]|jgi:phospholipid/cholesterol/gamma-HCH transport system permease protein|nr:ABC transporter permease [Planctomycetota bacterium]
MASWVRRTFGSGGALAVFDYPLALIVFFLLAHRSLWTEARRGSFRISSIVRRQIYFTAMLGYPVLTVAALSLGAIVFTNAIAQLPTFGAGSEVGPLTTSILFREIAPFLTALIVIARSGTAIATELGNMKIQKEMDFLISQGINIWYFVVFPRIQGMIVSMGLLVVFFDLLAFIGGYTIAWILIPGASQYPLALFIQEIQISHMGISVLKALSFGAVIGTVCSYHGLEPERSSTEVPQSATKGVVRSLALCILVNFFISVYL